jgi:hypothetical protein
VTTQQQQQRPLAQLADRRWTRQPVHHRCSKTSEASNTLLEQRRRARRGTVPRWRSWSRRRRWPRQWQLRDDHQRVDVGVDLGLNLGLNLGSLGGGKSAKGGGGMGKGRKGTASGSDAKGGAVACAAEVRVAGSVMVCVVSWTCERGGRWPARRLWCFVFNEFGVGMPCCCSTGRRRGHDRR